MHQRSPRHRGQLRQLREHLHQRQRDHELRGHLQPSCAPGYSDCDGDRATARDGAQHQQQLRRVWTGLRPRERRRDLRQRDLSGHVLHPWLPRLQRAGQRRLRGELGRSASNCGSCGSTCSNSNGSTSCSGGECVPSCADGFESCDGDQTTDVRPPRRRSRITEAVTSTCSLNNTSTPASRGTARSSTAITATAIATAPPPMDHRRISTPTRRVPTIRASGPCQAMGTDRRVRAGQARRGTVRVEETSSAALPNDLEVNVVLTVPAGADYDLFVRRDSCSGSSWSSNNGTGSTTPCRRTRMTRLAITAITSTSE